MKNVTSKMFAITAVIGLATSSSVSATSINSVMPDIAPNNQSTTIFSQVEYEPMTIQDYIGRARAESNADSSANSKSVSVIYESKNIQSVQDVIGSHA